MWGKGYTEKAKAKIDTFPIPQEVTFDKEGITLDKYTIKTLTRLVYRKTKRKPPNAIKRWNLNLADEFYPPPKLDWLRISQIYTSHFRSPKDYSLHFRHITNRGLITRVKMRETDITCRLCGTLDEHILELEGYPCIIKILRPLLRLAGHRSYTFTDILFAFPDEKNQGLPNMLIIAWKFIIRHFYQSDEQVTAYPDHATITKLTLA
jgi:hypothetical protein